MVADEQKVSQVLRNLISNALKFTGAWPGARRVCATSRWRERIVFAVQDTGIGIDAAGAGDDLPGVLADRWRVAARWRTGLGLPLSRRLAQLMGGDVIARSELGVGSIFELFLPVQLRQRQCSRAAP